MMRDVILGVFILAFNCNVCIAQNVDIAFEDFIVEHEGLDNTAGELVPINIDEIERKIRFYIEEKFPKIVENTDNISLGCLHNIYQPCQQKTQTPLYCTSKSQR